jgi:hypothetical protein
VHSDKLVGSFEIRVSERAGADTIRQDFNVSVNCRVESEFNLGFSWAAVLLEILSE